jgi:hypothetical protein
MDNQSGILVDIISNAINSVFSEFAQQQRYERTCYQQSMTSANIASSYGPIQQQSYEESVCVHPGALNYATTSMSTTGESTYGACLIWPCLHQDNFYQSMAVPHTALVPSISLPLPQVDFFRALGYTPQPLAQEDLFSALGHAHADTNQIQESTCVQYVTQELQSAPYGSQKMASYAQPSAQIQ